MDTSSVDHLPDEIIELILSKCPAMSVLRFKSVSKSWLSILSSPRFVRLHRIQRSKLLEDQKESSFFLWEVSWEQRDSRLHVMRLGDENIRTKSESMLGCPSYGQLWEPLCSCDGLILLFDAHREEYLLWNPFIRKHIIIPAFNPNTHPQAFINWMDVYDSYPYDKPAVISHLYHDSITDAYKIVCLYHELQCYAVYSCKNGSWEIKDLPCDWDPDRIVYRAGIDGCLYGMEYRNMEIVCLDARDGKLHKFPHPKGVEGLVKVELEPVVGRLCLYGFKDHLEQMLQLWVMEENGSFDKSWRKLISMEKKEPFIWYITPVYLTNKDNVVLGASVPKTQYGKYKYFIYNSRGNCNFKEIDFINEADAVLWSVDGYQYFFPYSENLDMPSSNICS